MKIFEREQEQNQDTRNNRLRKWAIAGLVGGIAVGEAILWGTNTSVIAIAGNAVEALATGVAGACIGTMIGEEVIFYPDGLN
ncbi:MAG TPA: hypothetical protein VMR08_01005 [Patescibacteria group bacterium]|jgi:hypothetical protein|nr:hypothetical protein [Patescibacteria group bacterium]